MSRRTIPLSVRTFGPFEPLPGYGPAVSSGIGSVVAPATAVVGLEDDDAELLDDVAAESELDEPLDPHALAIATTPAAPIHCRARRRPSNVCTS
jgi:hypothetical protein